MLMCFAAYGFETASLLERLRESIDRDSGTTVHACLLGFLVGRRPRPGLARARMWQVVAGGVIFSP